MNCMELDWLADVWIPGNFTASPDNFLLRDFFLSALFPRISYMIDNA
jgi:hypothetical protein